MAIERSGPCEGPVLFTLGLSAARMNQRQDCMLLMEPAPFFPDVRVSEVILSKDDVEVAALDDEVVPQAEHVARVAIGDGCFRAFVETPTAENATSTVIEEAVLGLEGILTNRGPEDRGRIAWAQRSVSACFAHTG